MGKALAAWLLLTSAMTAPAVGPRDVVQAAVARVTLAIQRVDTESDASPTRRAGDEERRAQIRRVAADLFDFDEMARRALSRHWTARSAEERAEFIHLFTDLLERTYIGRIEAYAGEKIIYLGESIDGPFATVRSKVISRRNTETPLDYRLHLRDGRWRVYDLLIDHVSFVATYRSEFSRILQRDSYAGLLSRLKRAPIDPGALVRSPRDY